MSGTRVRRSASRPRPEDLGLDRLFWAIRDAVVAADADSGRVVAWNPAAEALFGYPAAEAVGMPVDALVPDAAKPACRAALARAVDAGTAIELPAVRKDGRRLAVELCLSPLADARVPGAFVLAVVRDLSERRRAEAERLRLRDCAIAAAANAVLITDPGRPDNPIVDVNPAFTRITGYEREEALGRNCRFLQGPETDPAAVARLRAAIAEGREITETILNYRRDGTPFWNELRIAPVRDADGVLTHFVGVQADVTERVEAEAALRAGEARFRALVEQLPAVTYVEAHEAAGPDRYRYVSPQIEALLGYTPAEARADPGLVSRVIHPDDRQRVAAADARADETEEPFDAEYRVVARDGRVLWLRDRAVLVRDERGEEPFWLGVKFDVTAQKRAEAALAAERDLLDALLAQLPDQVYVKDRQARFVRLNPATARALGLDDPADALGKTDRDFFPDRLARRFLEDDRHVLETGAPVLNRLEPQEEGEAARWVLASKVPLRDAAGAIVGLIGINRDVTDQRRAEAAQRESARFVERIAAASPDILYVFDLDEQRNVYTNDRIADVLGLSREDARALGAAFLPTLMHPDDLARLPDIRAGVARLADGEVIEYECRMRRAGGDWRWFSVRETVFARHADGRVRQILGAALDVTEGKRAEAALRAAKEAAEAADRARARFLSTAAHELRTPLTSVVGYVQLLLSGAAGEVAGEQRELLEIVAESAAHLAGLVDALLDLSRLEAGASALDVRPLDVAEAVERARRILIPQAEAKGLALRTAIPADLPPVAADPDRLAQILLNLVGNAVKYTERGGVTVSARATDGEIEIAVADTGVGIETAALPLLFAEFGPHAGRGPRRGGAGLGLSIAKRLVALHGGTIRVESEPGVGSTFTVALPAAPASPESAPMGDAPNARRRRPPGPEAAG